MAERIDTVWQAREVACAYLEGVRGALPLAQEQIDMMLRLIAATGRPVTRALDLGCGDGVLAGALDSIYPDAALTLLDFSETMIEAARGRLGNREAPTHFIHADYGNPAWTALVADFAPFDAVVSGYSIHHQPDRRKRGIYGEIHDLLSPGGIFINIEHVSSATDWLIRINDELFVDSLHQARPDESREDVASTFYYRADKAANLLTSVEAQCDWLRQLGFTDVDCYLKVLELAVFGGRRLA